jgi:hypothetical protein
MVSVDDMVVYKKCSSFVWYMCYNCGSLGVVTWHIQKCSCCNAKINRDSESVIKYCGIKIREVCQYHKIGNK